jgi:RNA polymerase sigma-70 factor, ECF subfamily
VCLPLRFNSTPHGSVRNDTSKWAASFSACEQYTGIGRTIVAETLEMRIVDYIDDLYSYAVALTRNRDEAEDLVQETYVRALQAVNGLRPDSNLKAWLSTILRNIWLNQLRHSNSRPKKVELDIEDQADLTNRSNDPFAQYARRCDQQRLRRAILELPREMREILILREYQELPYAEIADLMACPIGTVMSRLARAREKLRSLLELTDSLTVRWRR